MDSNYDLSLVPGILMSKDALLSEKMGYYSARVVADDPSTYVQNGYSHGKGVKILLHTASVENHSYVFRIINGGQLRQYMLPIPALAAPDHITTRSNFSRTLAALNDRS